MMWLRLVLPRAWLALGGIAAVLVLLMLYRAQLSKAYERGYDTAQREAAEAAQAQAEAWADQVRQADRKAQIQADRANRAERASRDRIRTYFRDKPSSCGLSAGAVGLLHDADAERAAAYAAGRQPDNRKAAPAAEGQGGARGGNNPAD